MAMRAIWKGSISLGLVGVPVKLYSATEEKDIRFHQVHAADGAPAQKPYLLLREALRKSQRVGIVKVALRQREHLATLRIHEDTLTLRMMLWPDEIREPDFDFLTTKTTLRPQEKAMATTLVETMAGNFDIEEQTDDYRQAVIELVEAKLAGEALPTVKADKPTKATDLLAVLTASVEAAKSKKPPTKKAAKAATKKAPAKKAAQRKKAA